jgi:outer membrane protein insertion porin family
LEYTFPIPYLEAFRGAFFVDAGHVNRNSYRISFGDYSISIGPGVKIKTPIGPVAFYYGLPLANKDSEDRNGRFEFSLSRGF